MISLYFNISKKIKKVKTFWNNKSAIRTRRKISRLLQYKLWNFEYFWDPKITRTSAGVDGGEVVVAPVNGEKKTYSPVNDGEKIERQVAGVRPSVASETFEKEWSMSSHWELLFNVVAWGNRLQYPRATAAAAATRNSDGGEPTVTSARWTLLV